MAAGGFCIRQFLVFYTEKISGKGCRSAVNDTAFRTACLTDGGNDTGGFLSVFFRCIVMTAYGHHSIRKPLKSSF